jgi:hypothetical protein
MPPQIQRGHTVMRSKYTTTRVPNEEHGVKDARPYKSPRSARYAASYWLRGATFLRSSSSVTCNKMGAGQSASSKVPPRALHVLRVTPSSPASLTTIEPYFDFVVGFKDENLTTDGIDAPELERIVENHEGRPLDLLVWNSKSQTTRGKWLYAIFLCS